MQTKFSLILIPVLIFSTASARASSLLSCRSLFSTTKVVRLKESPRLVIFSAPSGGGKTTLIRMLQTDFPKDMVTSVSTTTRKPRTGETDGVDYKFTTVENFKAQIQRGEFLEWAEVHGNYYGTSKKFITDSLAQGKSVLLAIDVKGAAQVRDLFPTQSHSIFVMPPTLASLEGRLRGRGTDPEDVIQKRLKNAQDEIRQQGNFNSILVNDVLTKAYSDLKLMLGLGS